MAKFITVLCRLPSGVELELHDLDSLKERANSAAPIGLASVPRQSVLLNGAKHDPTYHPAEGRLLGRAGRTQVEEDFWNEWLKQNERNDLVTRKLVFAEASPTKADAALAELSKERTGLEGNDPDNLPKDVSKLEKE
ncbi:MULTISPECIES: hypothetical protein [unclassified Saccharibacter]|uniref:hypothetical protein n=1 Tax=unclassified Saccharibacter TaxID=2648722 RepID=UPI0013289A8E|nr:MULTISPECIES: hypothetical protein [unclassified Saccharibacter]MXV35965.1 hypothetical protein [Saccharibacter sp. EH611]MXV58920.1 hypothetical protein [Saccharibacter sp. EH70]MXV65889.1 hypothetical protein [Saccharibacter sp. EH60]